MSKPDLLVDGFFRDRIAWKVRHIYGWRTIYNGPLHAPRLDVVYNAEVNPRLTESPGGSTMADQFTVCADANCPPRANPTPESFDGLLRTKRNVDHEADRTVQELNDAIHDRRMIIMGAEQDIALFQAQINRLMVEFNQGSPLPTDPQ